MDSSNNQPVPSSQSNPASDAPNQSVPVKPIDDPNVAVEADQKSVSPAPVVDPPVPSTLMPNQQDQVAPETTPPPMGQPTEESTLPDFTEIKEANPEFNVPRSNEPELPKEGEASLDPAKLDDDQSADLTSKIVSTPPATPEIPIPTNQQTQVTAQPPTPESKPVEPTHEIPPAEQVARSEFGVVGQQVPQIPSEILGFSWSAFFGNVVWAVGNRAWIGLLGLLGPLWLIMIFVLGAKGNQIVWQSGRFKDVESFQKSQKAWLPFGVIIFIVEIAISYLIVSAIISYYSNTSTIIQSYPYDY